MLKSRPTDIMRESDMVHRSKEDIASLVRNEIYVQTGKSKKAMHQDTRIYDKDAEGAYPKNYSGKNLGITMASMECILLELESTLQVDFGLEGKWEDPSSYYGTAIEYNKNTRLHHLIDFVHNRYNQKVQRNKEEEVRKEIKDKVENTAVKGKSCFYIIKIIKDNSNLYVTDEAGAILNYAWCKHFTDAYLFSSEFIKKCFDMNSDDVISSGDPETNITKFLKTLSTPFEIAFIKLEVKDIEEWTYAEEDKVNQILSKLSPEEAQLIKSRFK